MFDNLRSVLVITHQNYVITRLMASQITNLTSVYSTVYLGTDQRKYKNSASLAYVRGIHLSGISCFKEIFKDPYAHFLPLGMETSGSRWIPFAKDQ